MIIPPRRSVALALVGLLVGGAAAGGAAEVVNRVLLRVNDQIATQYDYEQALVAQRGAIENAPNLTPQQRDELLEDLPRSVLGGIFDRLLIESRAEQLGVTVTDFEIDEAMAQLRRENQLEDDRAFQAALASEGLTVEELRRRFRFERSRQAVVSREVRPRIEIGDEELRQLYRERQEDFRVPEQVEVREIVVLEDAGAEELAVTVRSELVAGATFEEVKERYGDRLSSILDIGWVAPGDLDPAIEAAVWELEPGEYSEPTTARGGLHVARVIDRREATVLPFEEVKDRLYGREFNRRIATEFDEYLRELEQQAYVRCVPPEGVADFCEEKVRRLRPFETAEPIDERLGLDDVDRLFAPQPTLSPPVEEETGDEESLAPADEPPRR